MTDTITVTTRAGEKGAVTRLHAEIIAAPKLELRLDSGVNADDDYQRQVEIASDCLVRVIATLPTGFIDSARSTVRVCVRPAEDVDLSSSSHGLALLIAGVANVADLQPLPNRVFSAALQVPQRADAFSFESVDGIAAKASALGKGNIGTLYYFRRSSWQEHEDPQIHASNLAYARGDGSCRCEAIALPVTCSTFNLFNVAFEPAGVWQNLERAATVNAGASLQFAARLLWAALREAIIPEEFPVGIGEFLASLRKRGCVPQNLAEQLNLGEFVRKVPSKQVSELIKIAISESADRSVEEDLEVWLNGDAESPDLDPQCTPLPRMTWVLDLANLNGFLPPELHGSARALLIQRTEEALRDRVTGNANIHGLNELVQTICSIRSEFDGVFQSAHRLLTSVRRPPDPADKSTLDQCVELLTRKLITPVDLATAAQPTLALVFQDGGLGDPEFANGCDGPWPPVAQLNPLEVRYEALQGIKLTVPSPVLLFEHSQLQAAYTRRSGFRLVDDTFARLPWAEAQCVRDLFGAQPNRIAFRLTRPGNRESDEVGVYWDPIRVPFPPAIDTQFLVAALQRWAHGRGADEPPIKSIADIGCGTGFLAAAASYLFPSVTSIDVIDVDDENVHYATENLRARWDAETRHNPTVSIRCSARGFEKWTPKEHLDLLICNPPYLPALHSASAGIERATNGTDLLQAVIRRAPLLSRYSWLVFSALAWREFELAIAPMLDRFESIVIVDRQLVPLRINWLEPQLPEESQDPPEIAKKEYEQRAFYYENVLVPRGLIDLDDRRWEEDIETRVANSAPALFAGTRDRVPLEDQSELDKSRFGSLMQDLREHSRGFRHWHETRVVMLVAKPS